MQMVTIVQTANGLFLSVPATWGCRWYYRLYDALNDYLFYTALSIVSDSNYCVMHLRLDKPIAWGEFVNFLSAMDRIIIDVTQACNMQHQLAELTRNGGKPIA